MRRTDSLTAAYPIRSTEGETTKAFPQFPVINQINNAYPATSDGTAPLVLGQTVLDKYGFLYIYVQATEGLAAGQVVTYSDNISEGAIQATDSVADNIHVLKVNFTGLTAGEEVGNFLHIGNSTGSIGDLKLIKKNTTSAGGNTYFTISGKQIFQGRSGYDADAPAAAYAAAGSEVSLIRNFRVQICGADELACGVSMGTVTSGYDTLVQIEGLASCKGKAADAFTDNGRVYSVASGEVSITAGAEEAVVGHSKSAYAGANSVLVPVWLSNISGKW